MIKRTRAVLAAILLAAGLGAGMLAPAAQAATAGHHSPAAQTVRHASGKRISCDLYYACFWQNDDLTGDLWETQTPVNQWATIPVGNRGSIRNKLTTKVVWEYDAQGGFYNCAADSGGSILNHGIYGHYYIDTGDSCAASNQPVYP